MDESPKLRGQHSPGESDAAPAPLAYESPLDRLAREPQVNVIKLMFHFSMAFIAAGGGILYVTAFLYMVLTPGFALPASQRHAGHHWGHLFVAGIYGLVVLRVLLGLIRTVKTPGWKAIRRWEVLGTLLGAGMALLIGGLCFGAG